MKDAAGSSIRNDSNVSSDGAYVALLRGINVGGKNMLPMKDLVGLCTDAGCGEVKSYIQSGNLVFRAKSALAPRLPDLIEKAISDQFGIRVPVVVRSADELRRVAKGNPFLRAGADAGILHVAFLSDLPKPASVAALDPNRSPPDQFTVRGREIYLQCPNGIGRTKLTNQYFDSKLGLTSTVRNWNTVLKLLELVGG
jgi:uncharacterized protein (DUF1697 family)